MNDTLNLDELLPEPKTITIQGKEYECKVPTVEQMLRVADLEVRLSKVKTVNEAVKIIDEALQPLVPGVKTSSLTKEQLIALTNFILTGSKPERLEKAGDVTPKKK